MSQRCINVGDLRLTEAADSLCVGTDAILCAAYMRSAPSALAVEFGAGSGIISLLALKSGKFKHVSAVEIQASAAEICQKNVIENGFSDKMTVICRDIRDIDPSDHIGVSVVFSNPPYMRTDTGRPCTSDSANAARHELNGDIYDFCRAASRLLKTGGSFYTVYRPNRLPALLDALMQNRLSPKRMTFVHSDEFHAPSSVLIEARKDGGEDLFLTPPLIIKKDNEETEAIKQIYSTGNFPKNFVIK